MYCNTKRQVSHYSRSYRLSKTMVLLAEASRSNWAQLPIPRWMSTKGLKLLVVKPAQPHKPASKLQWMPRWPVSGRVRLVREDVVAFKLLFPQMETLQSLNRSVNKVEFKPSVTCLLRKSFRRLVTSQLAWKVLACSQEVTSAKRSIKPIRQMRIKFKPINLWIRQTMETLTFPRKWRPLIKEYRVVQMI